MMYNQHKREWSLCGYETAENCTTESTYCGNGSTLHIHANACRDCGNPMSSTSQCMYFKSNYCSLCGIHRDAVQAAALEDLNTKQ